MGDSPNNSSKNHDYSLMHPYFKSLQKATDYYNPGATEDLAVDVMPEFSASINPHKVFHLMCFRGGIGGINSMDADGVSKEDWRDLGEQVCLEKYRDSTHSGFSESTSVQYQKVSDQVLLFNESKSLEFELKNQYGKPIAALLDKLVNSTIGRVANDGLALIAAGGAIAQQEGPGSQVGDVLNKLAGPGAAKQVAGSQQYMMKYKNIPAWVGTDNLAIPSTLTFKFAFGQAGLFDAAEEVVRPILALALYFAPSERSGGMVQGVLPTESYVKVLGAYAVSQSAVSAAKSLMSGDNILNSVNAVYSTLNKNVSKIYDGAGARGIMIARYGNLIIPPFVVSSVKWKFDMSQVDENGYPYRGELTLGGIESFQMATRELIKNTVSKQFAPKGER